MRTRQDHGQAQRVRFGEGVRPFCAVAQHSRVLWSTRTSSLGRRLSELLALGVMYCMINCNPLRGAPRREARPHLCGS